jgi:hypothetical protein
MTIAHDPAQAFINKLVAEYGALYGPQKSCNNCDFYCDGGQDGYFCDNPESSCYWENTNEEGCCEKWE